MWTTSAINKSLKLINLSNVLIKILKGNSWKKKNVSIEMLQPHKRGENNSHTPLHDHNFPQVHPLIFSSKISVFHKFIKLTQNHILIQTKIHVTNPIPNKPIQLQ